MTRGGRGGAGGELGVAVAQLDAEPFDVTANVARGAEAIREAAGAGADLVVLPELLPTGYVMDAAALRAAAEPVTGTPGPALRAWCRAAAEDRVAVVAGFAELAGDVCYNSAVVIDAAGEVVEVYRKAHLFDAERGVFAPGNTGFPIATVAGVPLGVLVCYDLRFPEALRILALRGAQVVCVPTAWVAAFDRRPAGAGGPIPQVTNAIVQANLNQIWVAAAGRTGEDAGVDLLGSSVVVDPYGNPVAGPLGREQAVVCRPVRPAAAVEARERGGAIRPRADRRTDLYDELLGYREPAARRARAGVTGDARGIVL